MTDYPIGVDVSKYQGDINFDVLNNKAEFIGIRATVSWGYVDPKFQRNWTLARLPRLAYHVIYPGEDARRQTDHFLSIVKPGEHDRLVLDMELDHGYNKTRITDTLEMCLVKIWDETGRYPVIYSRASWVNQFLDVSRLPKLDWWLAGYLKPRPAPLYTPEATPPPALPRGVNSWLIHQTGERGNGSAVGVASHYVDTNRWNGTNQELLAFFGLTDGTPPEPEPPIPPAEKLFDARVYSWATPYVNIRKEPRIDSEDLGDLKPNTIVPVYEIIGDWYGIGNGFVMSKYLERLDFQPPATIIDIPPLSQKDPRWKDIKLGNSNLTIGSDGCLDTCFAMAFGVTPDEFNARMKAVGGFTGARIYWQMVKKAYPDSEYLKYIECYNVPAPLNEIDALLAQGVPVMVHVTRNGYQHWILIIGKSGGDYIANDPIDGKRISFRERYGDPARWIFRIRAYRKVNA